MQTTLSTIDATKILRKIKLHLLGHLVEDIRSFGPLLGVATESFESYNGVFRACSVLSNHRAPSRDIAKQIGNQEGLKHRLSGGWWYNVKDQKWTQSGSGVKNMLKRHSILRGMLGWSKKEISAPGTVIQCSIGRRPNGTPEEIWNKRHKVKLSDTFAKNAINATSYDTNSIWNQCQEAVAASGDSCSVGSWVFFKSPVTHTPSVGRISNILLRENTSITIIEEFSVAPKKNEFFGLPYVYRRQDEVSYVIIPTEDISFLQNMQHDCRSVGCEATGVRKRMNERKETEQTQSFIEHKEEGRYLINLHSFHNAHLIRHVLPRELCTTEPLFPNCLEKHLEIASKLQGSLAKKKEATRQRRAEKKREAENNADDGRGKRARTVVTDEGVNTSV
ncbi:hypothetical protein E1B28_011950 [Marasmius oreades]|uniref:Uncharacterized protein n=1 Tax=Marasmius oreades TaxID=181124 RepID=A0A9P7UN61_9AGAR|nr:uncharacterized protein E1B28_011950 [Marasmius oreades]KAG7087903.1 hypothetical protein E1B28_011950 [Marasmius oreades]